MLDFFGEDRVTDADGEAFQVTHLLLDTLR